MYCLPACAFNSDVDSMPDDGCWDMLLSKQHSAATEKGRQEPRQSSSSTVLVLVDGLSWTT